MKKILALLLTVAMVACLFAGCQSSEPKTSDPATEPSTDNSNTDPATDPATTPDNDDNTSPDVNGAKKVAFVTDVGNIDDHSFNQYSYEGVTKFVMDVMTSYGINACPPLLVGVGVATSVETAALLSKKALMRPLGSHNENERAAYMEKLLEDGINSIGLGPQGMGGKYSVMGVHIENTARHPSAIGVAVNVGCWSHRRGHIIFDKDLNYTIDTHSGVTL